MKYPTLKQAVLKKIKKKTFDALFAYVEKHPLKLWGAKKDRLFLRKSVFLALYKDLEHVGYSWLSDMVKK